MTAKLSSAPNAICHKSGGNPVKDNGKLQLLSVSTALVLLILLPFSPTIYPVPDRDTGVFLYFGDHILQGAIPYRDMWDHKPPGIFIIYALGQIIGFGTAWGVWLLNVVTLILSVMFCFDLLKKAFSFVAALAGTTVLLIGALLTSIVNTPESYALPLLLAAYYLYFRTTTKKISNKFWFYMGVIFGTLFILKYTLIGIIIAIGLYSLWKKPRQTFRTYILCASFGASLVFSPVLLYLWLTGALSYFWNAALIYNSAYTNLPFTVKLLTLGEGLAKNELVYLVIPLWLLISMAIVFKKLSVEPKVKALVLVCLLDFPLELILTALSGKNFTQYYVSLIPGVALLVGFSTHIFLHRLNPNPLKLPITLILLGALCILPLWGWLLLFQLHSNTQQTLMEGVAYIKAHSNESDRVLTWGSLPVVNYLAHRESPTRYIYQLPLYTKGYSSKVLFDELQKELDEKKPRLIIDTAGSETNIPPLDPSARENWKSALPEEQKDRNGKIYFYPEEDMLSLFDFIDSHYRRVRSVGPNNWVIYELIDILEN
ncbi:MAG: glycosyltransferase family 39 protein [Chloroflexi bacterium]|uniref:Glycosyltransferase family 39 protein n=1 Tax=Candidatus Chlorohelix allophototropha TaxID=3003348 RepID=A0A8T7M7Z6_9CHLR|nr:glycosyltransferase family 39 protein [Chloroflexota bacterium]WJW68201.1 glycosyltransferase family 39 protein [Chloroflexota bacterium L227-S17]